MSKFDNTLWGSGASQRQVQAAVSAYGDVTDFRTIRPQGSQTFTNLDEGTVLWARSSEAVTIEVITG